MFINRGEGSMIIILLFFFSIIKNSSPGVLFTYIYIWFLTSASPAQGQRLDLDMLNRTISINNSILNELSFHIVFCCLF